MKTLVERSGTWLICATALLVAPSLATPAAAQEEVESAQEQETLAVELVIATAVEDREPVGAGDSFPSDVGQLYAWLRVTHGEGRAVDVVWIHGGEEAVVPLEIGGSPWRTWSTRDISPDWTGEWTVEVRDEDGNVVASTTFTVEPPPA